MSKVLFNSISLENFKSFKDKSEFELAPITILVGPNNSGKSTFISSIKALYEAFISIPANEINIKDFLSIPIKNLKVDANVSSNQWKVKFTLPNFWLLDTLNVEINIHQNENKINKIMILDIISSGNTKIASIHNFDPTAVMYNINFAEFNRIANEAILIFEETREKIKNQLENFKNEIISQCQKQLEINVNSFKLDNDNEKIEYAINYFINQAAQSRPELLPLLEKAKTIYNDLLYCNFNLSNYSEWPKSTLRSVSSVLDSIESLNFYSVFYDILYYEDLKKEHLEGIQDLWKKTIELIDPFKKEKVECSSIKDLIYKANMFHEKQIKENLLHEKIKNQIIESELEIDDMFSFEDIDNFEDYFSYNVKTKENDSYNLLSNNIKYKIYPGLNCIDFFSAEEILNSKDEVFKNIFLNFMHIEFQVNPKSKKLIIDLNKRISNFFDQLNFRTESNLIPLNIFDDIENTIVNNILSKNLFPIAYYSILYTSLPRVFYSGNNFMNYDLNYLFSNSSIAFKLCKILLFKILAIHKLEFLVSNGSINKLVEKPYDNNYSNSLSFINNDELTKEIEKYISEFKIIIDVKPRSNFINQTQNQFFNNIHIKIKKYVSENLYFLNAIKLTPQKYIPLNNSEILFKKLLELQHQMEYVMGDVRFQNKYLEILNIGKSIDLKINNEFQVAHFELWDEYNNKKNLFYEGHGITQISLVCQLFNLLYATKRDSPSLIFIEEPEISLHPSLQSKLADVFKLAMQNNIQTVLETHSEYMIRKFQILVKRGELKPEDIIIYYLNPNDEKERIYPIRILENGLLDRPFGQGFFDEADDLAFDLFLN